MAAALAQTPAASGRGQLNIDAAITGWQAEATHRINRTWAVGGYVGGTWTEKPEAGVRLTARW